MSDCNCDRTHPKACWHCLADRLEQTMRERDEARADCQLLVREVYALGAGGALESHSIGGRQVAPAGSTPTPAPISDYRKSYALMFRRAEKERDEARKRLEQQTDWYQQRFNRLRKWVKEEVEPLSKEVAHRYFSICANGGPAPHESADWTDTMHGLKLRAEQAEKQRDEALFVRDHLEAITHEFECTIEYADTRGTGGVSLPFYGDFAPVVQLPSVISRMRRWAKVFREVLEKTK